MRLKSLNSWNKSLDYMKTGNIINTGLKGVSLWACLGSNSYR